jgi:hypothetical protein
MIEGLVETCSEESIFTTSVSPKETIYQMGIYLPYMFRPLSFIFGVHTMYI